MYSALGGEKVPSWISDLLFGFIWLSSLFLTVCSPWEGQSIQKPLSLLDAAANKSYEQYFGYRVLCVEEMPV